MQIDERQFQKVAGYIELGLKEGAKLETGGGRVGDKGFFLQPTVFSAVTDKMQIARDEVMRDTTQLPSDWLHQSCRVASTNPAVYQLEGKWVATYIAK